MFAARLLSFSPIFTQALVLKSRKRKNSCRTPTGITTTSLLCYLLISLPTLAIAEDATPAAAVAATDSTPSPEATTTQKSDDSEKKQGRVARAIFTSAIVDREPVDNLSTVSGDTQRVFFFSDLRELAGQIVTHRWEYNGKVMAEVMFKVGNGARWRVYSSKNLLPEWTGQWTVVVSNENGWPIKASMFEYSAEKMDKPTEEPTVKASH